MGKYQQLVKLSFKSMSNYLLNEHIFNSSNWLGPRQEHVRKDLLKTQLDDEEIVFIVNGHPGATYYAFSNQHISYNLLLTL